MKNNNLSTPQAHKSTDLLDTPSAMNDSITLQLTLRLPLWLLNELEYEAKSAGHRSANSLIRAILENRSELRANLRK